MCLHNFAHSLRFKWANEWSQPSMARLCIPSQISLVYNQLLLLFFHGPIHTHIHEGGQIQKHTQSVYHQQQLKWTGEQNENKRDNESHRCLCVISPSAWNSSVSIFQHFDMFNKTVSKSNLTLYEGFNVKNGQTEKYSDVFNCCVHSKNTFGVIWEQNDLRREQRSKILCHFSLLFEISIHYVYFR